MFSFFSFFKSKIIGTFNKCYNITLFFSPLKRLEESRLLLHIREQIIGIVMFQNVLCLKCQLLSFLSCYHLCIFTSISRQNQTLGGVENLLNIQVSVCYITLRTYITLGLHLVLLYSLKIQMTSHPCNKYEQIMLSYLPSVNYIWLV